MEKKIVINYNDKQTRVALLENGRAAEIYMERPIQQRMIGNIYKGKVENVLPGMQAAFVNIGEGKNAFFYVGDVPYTGEEEKNEKKVPIQRRLQVKEEVLVQVMKESFGSKGARLTGHITLPGRYLVLMPSLNYVGVSRRIQAPQERERLKKEMEALRPPDIGVIVRTAAEGAPISSLKRDLRYLLRLWDDVRNLYEKEKAPALLFRDEELIYRVVRDFFNESVRELIIDHEKEYLKVLKIVAGLSPKLKNRVTCYHDSEPIFERYGVEEEIEQALGRLVWLKCGGYLVFDETEALTAIDVNTGKYTGRKNLEETILKTNLEAATEIARQIRLRDIGGMIIVDIIDMNKLEHRQQVLERLKQGMGLDRTKNQVLGFTSLGLIEITRKRVTQGLSAIMQQPCSYCHGKGRVLLPEMVSDKVERELKKILHRREIEAVLVETNSEVAALLIGSGGTYLKKLEAQTGKNIFIRGSDSMHVEKYNILMSGSLQEVARHALPVEEGGLYRVTVEEPHFSQPGHGIARLDGYVLDIEDGAELVGEEVQVVIKEAARTFARAVVWKKEFSQDQF
ncbi:MAG: Rne/Rng family ribonuclease [Firmicutes bacterium]|mgnify:CR=1 FL=1|nr:Rne/Rng family ribonuclease [Bacillota bacterium]